MALTHRVGCYSIFVSRVFSGPPNQKMAYSTTPFVCEPCLCGCWRGDEKPNHTMRKIFLIALGLLTLATASAQSEQKDVTKFLGIPVDGYKHEMIQKLKEKGFVSSSHDPEVLTGEFNGEDVTLHVVTNNNKVYRIAVADKNRRDEGDIRIRFNNLCRQFMNHPKYAYFEKYEIPDDEKISFEMLVHKKRYSAEFYQQPEIENLDSVAIIQSVTNRLLTKYSAEQLENPTEEIYTEIQKEAVNIVFDLLLKKSVWFMISDFRGEYYISMFYDNEYNKANGEDL